MQFKAYEKSMLIYGRKKKPHPDKYQLHLQNKSHNLKSIHRNLVQTTKKQNYLKPQRSSVIFKNQHQNNHLQQNQHHIQKSYRYNNTDSKKNISFSSNKKQQTDISYQKKQKEKSMNFYINIQKLKNLKISSRDKRIEDTYSIKKSEHFSLDKGSLILRNKQIKGKIKLNHHKSSYESIKPTDSGKLITKNRPTNPKSKIRYKTHQNAIEQDDNPYRAHSSQYMIPKKAIFKRTNNAELKDKSFIDGYLKGKQLGRGGFSKVWQGFHFKTKIFYAIKQIDTTNKYQTHLTEIWFGNHFFEYGGVPKKEYMRHPGIRNLLQMYQYSIVDPRAFIVYENCDGSLGNLLYDIYQEDRDDDEIEQDEKLFMIKYKSLYGDLRKSTSFLKKLIKSMAEALDLLINNRIVHSDIKTENILLKKKQQGRSYDFKLIDYGSSFVFESLKQYKLATPQYMCPQLLNYILFQNKKPCHQQMLEYVKIYENISAIDIWGLGCVVLEIIHGLPLWLNNHTRILINGKYQTKKGLFAVTDRSFTKILQKQLQIVKNFDNFIVLENNSGILLDPQIIKVLKGMLNPNPRERIKPIQIVNYLSN